jgi:thioredoxin-dependent peroxiredoxin
MKFIASVLGCLVLCLAPTARAVAELKIGDAAPLFKVKTHTGEPFDMASRRGQWTVLYFYPKAATPGCTKQAQAFRDNMSPIRTAGAEIFGISVDSVADQAAFHADQQLTFTLLADADGAVVEAYGSKMFAVNMSKRWTFIIDPELKIRQIEHDVDPATDAQRVAAEIVRLQASTAPPQAQ